MLQLHKNINPYQLNNNIHYFSFTSKKKKEESEKPQKVKNAKTEKDLPETIMRPTVASNPVKLPDVPYKMAETIITKANISKMSVGDYLAQYLPLSIQGVPPVDSVTAQVGKTDVTTLIDANQIFNKTVQYLDSAKKSIQIEMFEFGNMDVDGELWPSGGAEGVEGWLQQQKILELLLKKKTQGVNVQVILDTHKWYTNGNGEKHRHYGNMHMIRYLKENGIDVVPYPRRAQQGGNLQHVKFLAVDSKKAILGGMNWGNHSPANHDACISIETRDGNKNSEVDNLIMEIFDSDWAFAWERIGKTKIINGPLETSEQNEYGGIKRAILRENIDYMKTVGTLFDNEEDKTRYKKKIEEGKPRPNGVRITPGLNLPDVNPLKKEDSKIKILTNLPREYEYVGAGGSESIGDYIKNRLDTAKSLRAELFALTHFEIALKIIERVEEDRKYKEYQEALKKGNKKDEKKGKLRPFDVQIIVDPSILDEFPYCRKVYDALREEGVPIRKYKTNKMINQRMHCKWAVFDEKELLIGSANWSAVGLETNLDQGKRNDYTRYNKMINSIIKEDHKEKIQKREKELGLPSIFNQKGEVNYDKLKSRRKSIKKAISRNNLEDINGESSPVVTIEAKDKLDRVIEKTEIKLTRENLHHLQKLSSRYKEVKYLLNRQKFFIRGNHESSVVIDDREISGNFLKQFERDWDHSKPPYEYALNIGQGRRKILTLRSQKEPNLF